MLSTLQSNCLKLPRAIVVQRGHNYAAFYYFQMISQSKYFFGTWSYFSHVCNAFVGWFTISLCASLRSTKALSCASSFCPTASDPDISKTLRKGPKWHIIKSWRWDPKPDKGNLPSPTKHSSVHNTKQKIDSIWGSFCKSPKVWSR